MAALALASPVFRPWAESDTWWNLGIGSARAQDSSGGGTVLDVPPEFLTFTASHATVDNSGASFVVFTGKLFDSNGELHFSDAVIAVAGTGAVIVTRSHTITSAETQTTAEPAAFGADGFKIYSETRYDGILFFKLKYTIPAGTSEGQATFTPTITTASGTAVVGPSAMITIAVHSEITVAGAPVDSNGASTAEIWGLWEAVPGATHVASSNFLKATNTGQRPAAALVVSFSDPAFTGPNANFTIPITENIQFAWCEVESDVVPPGACTFTFGATSPDGSVTTTFSGIGRVIYVQYRIIQIPPVTGSQTYGASYTATEL